MEDNVYIYQDQLETERLITRKLTLDDIPAWTRFFEDPEAVALFPTFGLVSSEERARHWVEKQRVRYAENRFGLQALIHKDTGDFIGQSGLLLQEVDGAYEVEVGYHIFMKYWGKGFAPEAAKCFIQYGFEHDLADSIVSLIDIRNRNSMRVADKNGLTREKQTRWADHDVYVYRIGKQDWV